MSDDGYLIRCPGCGNVKPIPMAVGQKLRCDVCQTVFLAPVVPAGDEPASPGDIDIALPRDPRSLSDSRHAFSVNDLPGASGTGDCGTDVRATRLWPAEGSPTDPSAEQPVERRSRSGSSWRGAAGEDPASEAAGCETDVPRSSGLPSSLEAPVGTAAAAVGQPTANGEPSGGARWRVLWSVLATLTALAALSGGVLVSWAMWRDHEVADAGADNAFRPAAPRSRESWEGFKWTDASRFSQRMNNIEVKILRATYGPVRVKDLNNQVVVTQDNNLLAFTISVHNQGRRPCPFWNWYENSFESPAGKQVMAELRDDRARSYALLRFDDATSVEGQRWVDSLAPRDRAQDTVVFLLPDEVDRTQVAFFRLSLPAAALGLDDAFRFEIPVEMIEGL